MVAMTYARNLVDGRGLRLTGAGRPVEGFTQPLLTALMVPVNALAMGVRWRSLVVQATLLAVLVIHVLVVRRLTLRFFIAPRAQHWMPAVLLTAFYYPLNFCSLMGLESGLQALVITTSVLLALDIVYRGEDRHLQLWLLGAIGCLLRLDTVIVVAAVQVYVIAKGGVRERRQRRLWLQGAALFVVIVAAYGAFQWRYFGQLVSNAWYLRFYRVPLAVGLMRGGVMLWTSISDHRLLLAGVAIGLEVLARGRRSGRDAAARMMLPAGLFLTACAISVVAGGDVWSVNRSPRADRFVVYVMPLIFVLCNGLINHASDRIAEWRPHDDLLRHFFVAVTTVVALLAADGLWLAADGPGNWMALLVGDPPAEVMANADSYARMNDLEATLGPAGVVATDTAGIAGYFTHYEIIDMLGGNESHIAHLAPAIPLRLLDFTDYVPGRVKWDHQYVLARYRPDAILAWRGPGDPAPLLAAAGYHHMREGDFWLSDARAAALGPRGDASGQPAAGPRPPP
jgi:hypothetical protein